MIELKHITKIYETNSKTEVTALDDVNLSFSDQGLIFILGQSGSGKTTLLNLRNLSWEQKFLLKNIVKITLVLFFKNTIC